MTGTSDRTPGSRDPLAAARDDARAAGSEVRAGIGELAQDVGEKVSDVAQGAGEKASEIYRTARDRASDLAEDGKRVGADQVSGVASAINKAADDLEETSPDIARHIRTAAESVEGISSALRERSAGQLLQDLTEFARRQPAGFFGLAAVTGFAIARFAKSSTAQHASNLARVDPGAPSAPGWTKSNAVDAPQPATMAAASLGGAAAHRQGQAAPGSMATGMPGNPSSQPQTASSAGSSGGTATPGATERKAAPL